MGYLGRSLFEGAERKLIKEKNKIYHKENSEEHNKKMREYYHKNKDDISKRMKIYYQNRKNQKQENIEPNTNTH